eukprot:10086847-Heterocapsa_arctica.AAC.1
MREQERTWTYHNFGSGGSHQPGYWPDPLLPRGLRHLSAACHQPGGVAFLEGRGSCLPLPGLGVQ